jgi:lipoate-protein ligase A
MPSPWYLLQSGPGAPAYNMALDETLLLSSPGLGHPVLRFYGWTEPAATFGFSQRYIQVAQWTPLRPLIRRPTGGGLVPHQADWTYSLVIPPTDPWYRLKASASYQHLHQWLQAAFAALGVVTELAPRRCQGAPGQCFLAAEQFDLLWDGQKIAGAAQRRTRSGLLIQGSVQPPPVAVAKADWQVAMCDSAHYQHGVVWAHFELGADLQQSAEQLAQEKYNQTAYNQRQ